MYLKSYLSNIAVNEYLKINDLLLLLQLVPEIMSMEDTLQSEILLLPECDNRYKKSTIKVKMSVYEIEFEPLGHKGKCGEAESLLACARNSSIGISSVCGGRGTCHACRIQLQAGTVSEPTANERGFFDERQLKDGWRLACQVYPRGNCKVFIPLESLTTLQRIQVEGQEKVIRPNPAVKSYKVKLVPPSLSDLRADADRVIETANEQHRLRCDDMDIGVLKTISPVLREKEWHLNAVCRGKEIIALDALDSVTLGLAVDLGSTKIAAYLVDLKKGKVLAAGGLMNPQVSYGEDIISRITAIIRSPEDAVKLQEVVVEAINKLADDLCKKVKQNTGLIADAVVVGNTAMHHIFLGLPVRQLALAPFTPAVNKALDIKARDIGIRIAPGAYVHLLPNIAGFVGADHISMLLGSDVLKIKGPVIAMDIGTNTEVSLIYDGKITSVSCASGPAFEGAHLTSGMRAAKGAIERLRIDGDKIIYETIDNAPPVGICGSGILDAVAQLYINGIIDDSGRFSNNHPLVEEKDGQKQFAIARIKDKQKTSVVINQHDIRQLQLGKAAIRTGVQVLLENSNLKDEDLEQIIIAGAFGTYIDTSSAIAIGILPVIPLDHIHQVGNAAGIGARMSLISMRKRKEAQKLAEKVTYIELASAPDFMNTFMQSNYLGKYRLTKGKRQAIS
jgi:uncharacterized 2Fe-2S/4Fe-4S cluster protein (DUF4445 family)